MDTFTKNRKQHIRNLKTTATKLECELWWDFHTQLWTLMDVETRQCNGHYYTGDHLCSMTLADFAKECVAVIRDAA